MAQLARDLVGAARVGIVAQGAVERDHSALATVYEQLSGAEIPALAG